MTDDINTILEGAALLADWAEEPLGMSSVDVDEVYDRLIAALDRVEARLGDAGRNHTWTVEKLTECKRRMHEAETKLKQAERERDLFAARQAVLTEGLARDEARAEADRLREALSEIVSLHHLGHSACFSDAADDYAETARAALAGPQTEDPTT